MKKEIDWKEELLESGRFNDQFSKGLLENGVKNFMPPIVNIVKIIGLTQMKSRSSQ